MNQDDYQPEPIFQVGEAAGSALRQALEKIADLTKQFSDTQTIGGDVYRLAERALAIRQKGQ